MTPPLPRRRTSLSLKISLLTILLVTCAIVITGVLTYREYVADMKAEMGRRLLSIARTAALGIDADRHQEILRDDLLADDVLTTATGEEIRLFGLDAYLECRDHLRAVKRSNELSTDIYTFRRVETEDPDGPSGRYAMEFVVLADDEAAIGNRLTELSAEQRTSLNRVFVAKRAAVTDIYTDPHGTWLSAMAPLLTSDGSVEAVLEIDYHVATVQTILTRGRRSIVLYSGVGTLAALGLTLFVVRWLTRPLKTLAAAMRELGEGHVPHSIEIASHDEIGFLAESFNTMLAGLRQRDFLSYTLQRYVGASVVDQILENPSLAALHGEKRELTVLFADIEGFTGLAEDLAAEEVVSLLNDYFEHLTTLIFEHDGTLDKYLGDAVMAVWGAPLPQADHALCACRAALAIQAQLDTLRRDWREDGRPDLATRIGLSTGEMIAGNIGSSQRLDYTVIGDAVNIGARLEGANREYGTRILVSETTFRLVRDQLELRELDLVSLRGRGQPLTIYELLAEKGQLPSAQAELVSQFEAGLGLYRRRQWTEAASAFQQCLALDPDDTPAAVYVARSFDHKSNPPGEDWAGVHVLTSK